MDQASSSSDNDFSSSSSSRRRGGSKEEDDYTRARRRAEIEPVDSDEDDGSSDDGEYNIYEDDGDLQDLQDINDIQQLQEGITNFDDLPTDDSEDDSDSDGSSDGDAKQHAKSYDSEEEEGSSDEGQEERQDEEDVPISERVASKAQLGRRYYTGNDSNINATDYNNDMMFDESGKKHRAERKSRAIERLREVLKKDKKKKKQSSTTTSSSDDVEQATSKQEDTNTSTTKKKKKSKHAPTEISSKRRDYFSRGRPDLNSSGIGISIGANKYKARDPRMTSLSGHLDDNIFDKRYSFLEEVQENEIKQLKLRINAWKQSGKKGQRLRKKLGINTNNDSLEVDQEELTNLLQQRAERKRSQVVRSAKKIVKQKIQQDVASGKRGAYYPKRSELKRMEAEAKYMEIRKRGGEEAVDKAIAKRRKKNMSKVAKSMPNI